jgi:hypothetical protein
MYRISPLRALVGGLVAGAMASFVQALFFKATARVMPAQPEGAFVPVEPAQHGEMATHTVARRFVEGMMSRELTPDSKALAGQIVHYAFGSLWGGLYGILGETYPGLRTPVGMIAYSTAVWGVGDNLVLPAFQLSAWPQAYPAKNHAYAWAAHVAYGAALWGSYEAIERVPWATALQIILLRRAVDKVQSRLGDRIREPIAALAPLVRKPLKKLGRQLRV